MARKSKKVDFVNVKDQNRAINTPLPEKSAVYQVALYARLSEETEANRERATIETQMELLGDVKAQFEKEETAEN